MEWKSKECQSCVDPALHFLQRVHDVFPADHDALPTEYFDGHELEIKSLFTAYRNLKFFKMFFWGLAYQEESSEDDWRLHYVWSNMMRKFTIITEEFRLQFGWRFGDDDDADGLFPEWEAKGYHLRRKIEEFKPAVKEICILVLEGAFIRPFHFEELCIHYGSNTISLVDLILENLGYLDSDFNLVANVKQHFIFIERKFKVFGKFATHISCLACLFWVGERNHDVFKSELERMLSDLTQNYMPYASGFAALYFDVFKGRRVHKFKAIRRLTVSYVDFLLEVIPLQNGLEVLHEGLLFLLSVFIIPVEDLEVWRLLFEEITSEVSFPLCLAETNQSNVLYGVDRVKVKLQELYILTPLSTVYNSPQPDAIGFLNFLLKHLKTMLEGKVDFMPVHIKIVHEELVSLQKLLQVKLEIENEHQQDKYVSTRIAKVICFAAYLINLCSGSSSFDWYGNICFPNLIEEIKLVQSESEVIEKNDEAQIHSHRRMMLELDKSALRLQPAVSNDEAPFIGFGQDIIEIRDHLVRGSSNLTIISISGMSGQGKTTLAKRIYDDPSIYYHFHMKVWCYVSKGCKRKELLKNIARDVKCSVDGDVQDLIERVWRTLRGKRYLIVLDDIWGVDVWNVLRRAFPNDQKGSRILFTSRNHDLALQAEPNSISHFLRSFLEEESRELMRHELSCCDSFPPGFLEIGEQIADLCKGLPLAIALIAPLLRRAGPVLDLWKQVAENLNSYLSGEGCMDILELSYTYLPHHLKPCFLYLGAFQRVQIVRAKQLKHLWIAEGFVKGNGMQLAEKYLDYLVSQSLVVVIKRSSGGGVKFCRVHHDLIYDLCLKKCVQDNFLHSVNMSVASTLSHRYGFHRLCVTRHGPSTLPKPTCSQKKLPTSQIHTVLFNSCSVYSNNAWKSLSDFLSNFTVLTVLDLGGLYVDMFPEGVLYNIHLRYLALDGRMEYIPASIADLWNLETLIVRCQWDKAVGIPESLWEMESLKYVHIIQFSLNLKNLWLNTSSSSMAATFSIKVLKRITLKYDVETSEFLGRLVGLRKLDCTCWCDDTQVIHPMWFSMFGSLESLESLNLYYPLLWFQPPPICQELPASFNFPNNLKKLALKRGFGLPWSVMSTVGKLSNLEVLKLECDACAGEIWHLGDGEFSKLRFLKLFYMDMELIDDSEVEDPFPCLEKLVLRNCERLKEIPSSFGDICTLKVIDVTESCYGVLDSARRILKQQQDMGNDHLQVLGLVNEHTNEGNYEAEDDKDDSDEDDKDKER